MHCYRTGTDDWFEFVGVQSPGHGPHYAYKIENQKNDHPVMSAVRRQLGSSQRGTLPHRQTVADQPPLWLKLVASKTTNRKPASGRTSTKRTLASFAQRSATTTKRWSSLAISTCSLGASLWAAGRDPEKHFHATDDESGCRDHVRIGECPTQSETDCRVRAEDPDRRESGVSVK